MSPAVDNAQAKRRGLDGTTATVTLTTIERTIRESFTRPGSADDGARSAEELFNRADGGITDYYANGGMRENHVAEIAPAGAWRVWAEPETGGEAYIPLAESKRRRSLEIWAQTGRKLGVDGYANGGIRGGVTPGDVPTVTASLVGARAKLVGPNLVEFVDGRVALGIAGEANYAAGRARARGRQ